METKTLGQIWDFLDTHNNSVDDLVRACEAMSGDFGNFEVVNRDTYETDGYFNVCNSYWNGEDYDYDYHTINLPLTIFGYGTTRRD